MRFLLSAVFLISVLPAGAQLSREQKLHDFQNLAGTYAKRYAPYEWKRQIFGFDLMNIGPWLDRVSRSRDDLDLYEIMQEYVASLQDTHSGFTIPSTFRADLGIVVDIYDGKVLIESINRSRLPATEYPFQIGDELVSVDGKTSEQWITEFSRFRRRGNPRATRRLNADLITFRAQSVVARAVELGDTAIVVIRRDGGAEETYTIPWMKAGAPLRVVGPVPSPKLAVNLAREADYLEPLRELTNFEFQPDSHLLMGETWNEETGEPDRRRYVLGLGSRTPVFAGGFPQAFNQRLGRAPADYLFSGTYESDGMRIGYLRIPNFAPLNFANAIREIETEVAFFEQNTDGLVVDVMRNTGGGCIMLNIASYLIPQQFFFFGEQIRATQSRINSLQASIDLARAQRADQWIIDYLTFILGQVQQANSENRGLTGPIPACSAGPLPPSFENQPAQNSQGQTIAYTKPLIVLIDDFSISAGDIFPAMMQDNKRGPMVGMRSNGAGGSVSGWPVGTYSESIAGNTNSLVTRIAPIITSDLPAAPYVENIGVRPDIELDYMTRDNLMNRGRPFVEGFTRIIVDHIRASR
jgi:C-terminal processing protease CtpA/Prc